MLVQHYAPNHMHAIKGIVNITAGLKPANLSQKVLTCMLSQEPLAGTLPNLHLYIFEWPWPNFQVTVGCETQINVIQISFV